MVAMSTYGKLEDWCKPEARVTRVTSVKHILKRGPVTAGTVEDEQVLFRANVPEALHTEA